MPKDIRIVCSAQLTREDWLHLSWPQERKDGMKVPEYGPFNVFAISGKRIVGYWMFHVNGWQNNKLKQEVVNIGSTMTYVARRYRREGLARRMWDHGVAFWRPTRIHATAATPAGWWFLRDAVLRYHRRGIAVNVHASVDDVSGFSHRNIYQEVINDAFPPRPQTARRRRVTEAGDQPTPTKTAH
jgi:hypothetical protein